MGFQTKQPYRLDESGEIVPSIDPRDFDSLTHWFLSQRWIASVLGYLVYCAVWLITLGTLAALYIGAGKLRNYLTDLLVGG